jgi:hypothetical protein
LETLCTSARDYIFDALVDLNNTQLLTANVLPEKEIFTQTKINSERIRTDTLIRFNNALKLIELSTRSNRISTELNTNHVHGVEFLPDGIVLGFHFRTTSWELSVDHNATNCVCHLNTCSYPSGFYFLANIGELDNHAFFKPQKINAAYLVPGFVASCTPLEAVLQATFVCLYDTECIKKLAVYFSPLARVRKGINRKIYSKNKF